MHESGSAASEDALCKQLQRRHSERHTDGELRILDQPSLQLRANQILRRNDTGSDRRISEGPSTDAIDLDVCRDILISQCYMNVNDDGVCLKGGKGTWVDTIPGNGPTGRVIVDRCKFGKTNAGVTFGSEAWDCSNVIMKDCEFDGTYHVLLFKMRPDTPQQYRNVWVEGARGTVRNAVEVQTWTQFFNKVDRDPMPMSAVDNVTFINARLDCTKNFYKDKKTGDYELSNFTFSDIIATAPDPSFDTSNVANFKVDNVSVTKK